MQKNRNSNNFFMGVSTKKEYGNSSDVNNSQVNNSQVNNNNLNKLKKYNFNKGSEEITNRINSANSPEDAKKIVFSIIDKLEKDIVSLNSKIGNLNKEKFVIESLSIKEIEKLKDVIKKLYFLLSSFNKTLYLSPNDRIKSLKKIKETIESNNSFLFLTTQIVKENKELGEIINNASKNINSSKRNLSENTSEISLTDIINKKYNNGNSSSNTSEVSNNNELSNTSKAYNNSELSNRSELSNNSELSNRSELSNLSKLSNKNNLFNENRYSNNTKFFNKERNLNNNPNIMSSNKRMNNSNRNEYSLGKNMTRNFEEEREGEEEGREGELYKNRINNNVDAIVEPLNFINNSTNKNKINNSIHMKESFSKNNKLINRIAKHKINNQSKANNYLREFMQK